MGCIQILRKKNTEREKKRGREKKNPAKHTDRSVCINGAALVLNIMLKM